MLIALAFALAAGGFASTYLGIWSPGALLSTAAMRQGSEPAPVAVFVDVPKVELNLPGGRGRLLTLSAAIETEAAHRAQLEQLMPRILDAYNGFLSGIDPAAYDKRGVLDIIRGEMLTRSRQVLGEAVVKDLLITEFLIR